MNALIIDDEPLTVRILKEQIPWPEIPIDHVYTANDTRFARQIMQNFPIQIILCDIEMPGENGLDFLAWTKENGFTDTVSILLTAYDDFSYARKGIQLGVLDYVLKPVAFDELTALLKRAVSVWNSNYAQKQQQQAGALWEEHLDSIVHSFWVDYFAFGRKAPMDGLGFDETSHFLLIRLHETRPGSSMSFSDMLTFLQHQTAPIFAYLHMRSCAIPAGLEGQFRIIAWTQGEKPDTSAEALQYVYTQMQQLLMNFHINQLSLSGCMNGFCHMEELRSRDDSFDHFLQSSDKVFGFFLADSSDPSTTPLEDSVNSHLMRDIADYVHRHLSGEINRQELADYVHLNQDYLTRLFRKMTGMTLSDYVRRERLLRARYLLQNTELSISEIAMMTGFNTPSHFSTAFRKEYEQTPNEFRTQKR